MSLTKHSGERIYRTVLGVVLICVDCLILLTSYVVLPILTQTQLDVTFNAIIMQSLILVAGISLINKETALDIMSSAKSFVPFAKSTQKIKPIRREDV